MRNDSNKSITNGGSLGSGYVTVIMIFVVICLTVLAALSFSASGSNSNMSVRSRTNMAAYYEAENRANITLMQLDETAGSAADSGLFSLFSEQAGMIEGVTVVPTPEGYAADWKEQVTERLTLECGAVFYSDPAQHDGKRYEITRWNTVSGGEADVRINVWDGTF